MQVKKQEAGINPDLKQALELIQELREFTEWTSSKLSNSMTGECPHCDANELYLYRDLSAHEPDCRGTRALDRLHTIDTLLKKHGLSIPAQESN